MSTATEHPIQSARESLHAAPRRELTVALATCLAALLLFWGWSVRDELYWTSERGLGYALGIVGLGCMVALLSYPVRKRSRRLRGVGRLPSWFRVHMLLGIAGPTAILFHANFRFGSINSTVALLSMLGVAGSGYAGRFIYARIHRGLFGERRALAQIMRDAEEGWSAAERVIQIVPELCDEVQCYEKWALDRSFGIVAACWRSLVVGFRAGSLQRRAAAGLRASGRTNLWFLESALDDHLQAAARVAKFTAWERLFSLWHAIHLPLCFLLFGAALVHVVVVHMF